MRFRAVHDVQAAHTERADRKGRVPQREKRLQGGEPEDVAEKKGVAQN